MKRLRDRGFLLILMSLFAAGVQAKDLAPSALESWLQKYGAAWEARDASAAGPLFSADATYQEMPFDPPKQGRAAIQEYWRTVTTDQREIKFESKVIAIEGDTGVAHWRASFKLASSGATVSLDGMFVLRFDDGGQCTSLREWWHVKAE